MGKTWAGQMLLERTPAAVTTLREMAADACTAGDDVEAMALVGAADRLERIRAETTEREK